MTLPAIPYNFYGAQIAEVTIGPRQEIKLTIRLWSQVDGHLDQSFNDNHQFNVSVRFGGIYNFEQVQVSLDMWEANARYDTFHYFRYSDKQQSKPGSIFFEIGFDATGSCLSFHCQSITITPISG